MRGDGDRILLNEPEMGDLRAMYSYWRGKRRGDLLPGRRDIDPLDFPRQMPRVALIDVLRDESPVHFRYRLAGTEIGDRAGRDPTGKRFDELYRGAYLEQALETYWAILEDGQPHFSRRVFPLIEGREYLQYARLILPLAADGRTIDMLLLVTAYLERVAVDAPGV